MKFAFVLFHPVSKANHSRQCSRRLTSTSQKVNLFNINSLHCTAHPCRMVMKPLLLSDIPTCHLRNLIAKYPLERYFQVSHIHSIFLQAEFIFKASAYLLVQEKDAKCHSYQLLNKCIWSIWKVLQKFETVNIFASCRKIRSIYLKVLWIHERQMYWATRKRHSFLLLIT